MKYIIFALCILILFIFPSCAEQQVEGVALRFEKEKYNFGDVAEGIKVDFAYKVKNIGTELLEIKEVRPACGCTAADDWDKTIEPGKWGKIPITFNTSGYSGEVSKVISIETNAPGKEEMTLEIGGNVITYLEISPDPLWLGELSKNSSAQVGTVLIKSTYKKPLKITGIEHNYDNLQVKHKEIEKGKVFEINAVLSPPFETGYQNLAINLLTDREDKPSIYLSISYHIEPDIEVVPQYIQVTENQLAEDFERYITIKNNSEKPISIKDVKIQGAEIKYRIEESEPGSLYYLALLMDESLKENLEANITVKLAVKTDEGQEDFDVPVVLIPAFK